VNCAKPVGKTSQNGGKRNEKEGGTIMIYLTNILSGFYDKNMI